jgi:hypothetical protein
MRAYLMTTGILFALLVVAHVWRMFAEGGRVVDPVFVVATLLAAALGAWAAVLLRRSRAA